MEVIADLQVHSKYARATSKDLSLENLEKWGKLKGLNLIGTGDFQHPLHRKEIDSYLKEDSKGILWSKTGFAFLWQTEVSLIFSQGGRRRAVHLLVFSPNKETTDKITFYLSKNGRIDYDGRPIFGITCRDFVHDMKEINDKIEIIPAHAFTPWFGLYGSDSGFNSLNECFLDMSNNIYAIESGMSADPAMIWRLKEKINIVSFSDAHSFWPWRLGREATIFDIPELSYDNIIKAIRTGIGLKATIETPPEYGKYHYDGHRKCNFSCPPEETKKRKGICPVCGRKMTIGVDSRIDYLAKESKGYRGENARPYYSFVPLHELIALVLNSQIESKKTWEIYNFMIEKFGNELNILLKVRKEEMYKGKIDEKIISLIMQAREGKLKVKPGYDGQYGKIEFSEVQAKLF